MAEIGMRRLMRHDRAELIVVCFLQQTGRHQEIAAARIARIDAVVVSERDLDLIQWNGSIHLLQQWNHDVLQTRSERRIDLRRFGLRKCRR